MSSTVESFFEAVLKGPRLILRPYSEERDLENVAALFQDPRVTGPIGMPDGSRTLEKVRDAKRAREESEDAGDWTVFALASDGEEFAGETGIAGWNVETHVVEVFAAISPERMGMAYGREAVSLLLEHIWRRSPVATARVQVLSTNKRALRLAESLGFRETGRRLVPPDPITGFPGGTGVILDCRQHEFRPFRFEKQGE
jgi:RimJ/RimL family protein N-acetyltransferase